MEKEQMITALDEIIEGLQNIKEKVINNIHLENEDWIKCATPLRETINLFINSKHINND